MSFFFSSAAAYAIPDSVVNRLPLDEGSGTAVSDSVGTADGALSNGGVWVSEPAYKGGTAPNFGGSGEYGSWQPRSTAPITIICRTSVSNSGDKPYVWGFDSFPGLRNPSTTSWELFDSDLNSVEVTTDSNTTDSIRIIATRLDSNSLSLDVWKQDGTKVGSDEISNPSTAFDSSTMYFANRSTSGGSIEGEVDFIDIHNTHLSDSKLNDIVSNQYL